jgi:hypothetical protein
MIGWDGRRHAKSSVRPRIKNVLCGDQGLEFTVQGLGSGFRVQGSRVQGHGFRVQVQGLGFAVTTNQKLETRMRQENWKTQLRFC